jgi:hypothetical protein
VIQERDMKADEVAELMDRERESDRFKQLAAVAISFLAMVLALTSLGGSNAGKDIVNNNVLASNFYSFYQAKTMRQTAYELAAEQVEFGWLNDPAMPETTKEALRARLEAHKRTVARYESDPQTQEGKKELLARAREHEQVRDHALQRDPYFDYAEVLLQIAIVLISVSIIANLTWLASLGGAIGAGGVLLTINGFFLLVQIPGLG